VKSADIGWERIHAITFGDGAGRHASDSTFVSRTII
jgi:hypothetical protein